MSSKHILKNTNSEIIFKCYMTESNGGTIEIDLETDCTNAANQVYVAPTSIPDESGGDLVEYTGSHVFITGIWWGVKKDKQLDITRLIVPETQNDPAVVHGHYYLLNSGFYDFRDGALADRVYATRNIRMIFDGAGHCILRLSKYGWENKLQPETYSIYDDETSTTG